MSDFDTVRFQYRNYYTIIGLRARGALGSLFIFKEYWYGRRVGKWYEPYQPRTPYQQGWRGYFVQGMYIWHYLPANAKAFYKAQAKRFYLYGMHRFLTLYLNAQSPFRLKKP